MQILESHILLCWLLAGQILGKALYEGMLLDIPLAPFFLLQLQGRTLMFDDLYSLDPELHKNLLQVCEIIFIISLGLCMHSMW